MKFTYLVGLLVGVFIAFLGLLWFLQGSGILQMRPILCVTNCEEIVGTSPTWAIAGAITFIIGSLIAYVSVSRLKQAGETKKIQGDYSV
jgi:hypothetical protein